MALAVLDARCGLALAGNDVYLNVAGGLRISIPAADLAVAAALLSSANDVPVQADMVVFGEIGLSGEVRAVSQRDDRLKEATKLGFAQALMPVVRRQASAAGKSAALNGKEGPIGVRRIGHVQDLMSLFRPEGKA